MLSLRIATLGIASVQDALFFDGAKAFVRCLPCEDIAEDEISLAPWLMIGTTALLPRRVRVEGIHVDEPLAIPSKDNIYGISNWIRPSSVTNANLVHQSRKDRGSVERLIKRQIEGQTVCIGADAYSHLSIPNTKAAIITGVAGSGKKTLVRSCCRAARLRVFPLSLAHALSNKEVMESDQASGLSHIRTVFDMALQSAPSAVILEDIDTIAKERGVDSLLQSSTVFVLAISRNRAKLPAVFLKQGIFQHEFHVPIPIKTQRKDMVEALISSQANADYQGSETLSAVSSRVAQMTSGYVAKDIRNLCRSALLHALRRGSHNDSSESENVSRTGVTPDSTPTSANWDDFGYAINTSRPSQQIEFDSLSRPQRRGDYGGYQDLKRRVHQSIHWPISNPETFKRMGVRPPMGLLLYGPTGCGKTMLVQTLAAESDMNFIPIKGPEIFSKYLGETEATLRRLFAMARRIAPCILFFDEMDSIGAKRGWGGEGDSQSSNGVNERVLSTLLNEMDGVEERTGVFVIGCTNQPQAMDDALMRPGRLDQLVYVGYPTRQYRVDIINVIGERIPLPTDPAVRMELAKQTAGFSPADLEALFREAAIISLRRDIASKQVDQRDIDQVLKTMKPSVQDRIANIPAGSTNDCDIIVPELYRQFQQDR
ncbi:hypothetical protein BGZ98_004064 [Dissophora globulifera]|nr:hypothetical protein BGZ98_004064 [Dissophora globulifera]